jgi:hypothetical protein
MYVITNESKLPGYIAQSTLYIYCNLATCPLKTCPYWIVPSNKGVRLEREVAHKSPGSVPKALILAFVLRV